MTTSGSELKPDRLPPNDGLTVNRVAKRCNVSRDEIQTMIGVMERHAGLLPQETDEQGQRRRVISERLLLPHFQIAAYLMRVEHLTATDAMEATLNMGVNYCLPRLSQIVTYLDALRGMPHELRDAARDIQDATRRIPTTVSILDHQDVRWALEGLQEAVRRWQIVTVTLMALILVTVLVLVWQSSM